MGDSNKIKTWRLKLSVWYDYITKRSSKYKAILEEEMAFPVRTKAIIADQVSKLPEKDQIKSAAQARLEQAKELAATTSALASEVSPEEVKAKLRGRQTFLALIGLTVFAAFMYFVPTAENQTLSNLLPSFSALIAGFVVGAISILLLAAAWFLAKNYGLMAALALLIISPFVMIVAGDIMRDERTAAIKEPYNGGFGFLLGAGIAIWVLSVTVKIPVKINPATKLPIPFGTSRWATLADLENAKLIGRRDAQNGLFLGYEREGGEAIIYDGDMHGLTVAPTRTGKGASAIIPNILRSGSSMLVIDPKGENAKRTLDSRLEKSDLVFVVDPWGISLEADQYGSGIHPVYIMRYNPLADLDADDPDLASDAMILADSFVIEMGKDPFWANEAKAMLQGFMMHIITSPDVDDDERHLGTLRDILCLPPREENPKRIEKTLDDVIDEMSMSVHPVIRQAASRFWQKASKERSSVISTAQSSTHFLDSPKIRESLSRSSFSFKELKTSEKPITVFLVLPLDRMKSFNRWLRVLLSSAMIDLTRIPHEHGKPPVRVILDEFAALDKLDIIETAYGTMAGMGVQLWIFTQDLGQLMRLYGEKSWQTFVSNAGVFQYFGSRDYETAKYAEHLCGMTTMKKASLSFGRNWGVSQSSTFGQGSSSSTSGSSSGKSETISWDDVSRPLAYADEMMTLHRDLQLLFIENNYPIVAEKEYYFRRKLSATKDENEEEIPF